MAAGKIFAISFAINAAMGQSFASTMAHASGSFRQMGQEAGAVSRQFAAARTSAQSYLAKLMQVENRAASFANLKRAVGETSAELEKARAQCNQLVAQFNQSKAETDRLKASLDQAKASLSSMRGSVPKAEYQAMSAAVKQLGTAYRESAQQTRELGQAFGAAKNHAASMKATLASQNASLQSARAALQQAGFSTREYAASQRQLQAAIQQATRAQQAQAKAAAATNAAQQAKANLSSTWGNAVGTMASASMVATPFIGAIETAASFEAAMSKVKAITRSSDADMQQLTANARMLGETTQFSASQAAEAMSYLGMAGWNASQIIGGMPGLLALAAAGGTDLARTADIVSDDLTAFGLSADDAGHMADVFAVTVTRTNTNVEMLGETMKYAAPVAKAFGASMEETAALAGIMANSGIKASQAGTSLRAGFLRLAGPPKKASKAMDELGISLSDVTAQQQEAQAALASLGISMEDGSGGQKKMSAVLTELRDKTAGLGREEKLATLATIFGTEAATGWLAVLDAGPETFDSLVNEMENCDGEAEKMAETMMDNAKGAWVKMKSALEGLAISIGSIFLPALTSAGNGLADMAGAASKWVGAHEEIVAVLGSVIAAVVSSIAVFQSYKVLGALFSFLSAQASAYLASIEATTVGQRALTAATTAQTRAMSLLRTATSGATYRKLAQEAAEAYARMRAITWASIATPIRTSIVSSVNGAIASLRQLSAASASAATSARAGIVQAMSSIAANATRAGSAVMMAARNFTIAGALQTAANGFRALGSAIFGASKAALAFAFSPLGIALIAIAGAAYLIYSNWAAVGPFFMGLWAQIQAAFASAWAMISPALDALGAAFMMLGPAVMTLGATFMAAFDQISAAVAANSGPLSELMNIGLMIAEIFGGVLVGAFIIAADVMVGMITGAVQMVASIITMLIGVLTGLVNFVAAVFTGNWSAAWSAVGSIVSSIFSGVYNTIMGFVNGIMGAINNVISSAKSIPVVGGLAAKVFHNAEGGIYQKGAFLTTFAEEGPEAAIPLDGSTRAVGIWKRAGEILGVGSDAPMESFVGNGNVSGVSTGSAAGFVAPPINIQLTFNGPADAQDVRAAVEDAGQTVQQSFAEQMAAYMSEKGRRAYV